MQCSSSLQQCKLNSSIDLNTSLMRISRTSEVMICSSHRAKCSNFLRPQRQSASVYFRVLEAAEADETQDLLLCALLPLLLLCSDSHCCD